MEKILVIGPAWVGDMVLAQSLFITLARHHPDAVIDVLAPAWTQPLLARMPQVRRAIPLALGHGQLGLFSRLRLGVELRRENYTRAIILPRSWKSALVPWRADIPRRTGFLGELRWGLLNDIRPLDKKALPRTVDRFVALGQEPGTPLPHPFPVPALVTDAAGVQTALARLGLTHGERPMLALCPGAEYGPAKQWPLENYATVARSLLAQGWQVWIFGSHKDKKAGEEILALAPGAVNLAGATALGEAVDLLALADGVVSNDSGLMHVAAALGRRVIALFGSSDPRHTPPMGDTAQVIWHPLECSPCFKRKCRVGDLKCLTGISSEEVLAKVLGQA